MISQESRYMDFNRKFKNINDDRLIDHVRLTDRPGTIDIYLTNSTYVGCIPNPELRDEIVRRFNEGAADDEINELREEAKEWEALLKKEGFEDLEALNEQLQYYKWLAGKTKALTSNLEDISAINDSQIVQDVMNTIIDSLKKVTNALDKKG